MKYDSDLKLVRRVALVILVLNVGNACVQLVVGQWWLAVASFIWAITPLPWLYTIKAQQQTRDLVREAREQVVRIRVQAWGEET